MKKPNTLNPTLPPITLLLHEYHINILLRALIHYTPVNEDEAHDRKTLLDILELLATD
jgi:hypothetical protein